MKKTVARLIALAIIFMSPLVKAQNVFIPDANFKEALLINEPTIDINKDGEIQFSEAENYSSTFLDVSYLSIQSLQGIEAFVYLKDLSCAGNNLEELHISKNINLEFLFCSFNEIKHLNLSKNIKLLDVYCDNNHLRSLNMANKNNEDINNFDATNNPELFYIELDYKCVPTKTWFKDELTSYTVKNNIKFYELASN